MYMPTSQLQHDSDRKQKSRSLSKADSPTCRSLALPESSGQYKCKYIPAFRSGSSLRMYYMYCQRQQCTQRTWLHLVWGYQKRTPGRGMNRDLGMSGSSLPDRAFRETIAVYARPVNQIGMANSGAGYSASSPGLEEEQKLRWEQEGPSPPLGRVCIDSNSNSMSKSKTARRASYLATKNDSNKQRRCIAYVHDDYMTSLPEERPFPRTIDHLLTSYGWRETHRERECVCMCVCVCVCE